MTSFKVVEVACDGCDEVFTSSSSTFAPARQDAEESGWKCVQGGTTDYCPKCRDIVVQRDGDRVEARHGSRVVFTEVFSLSLSSDEWSDRLWNLRNEKGGGEEVQEARSAIARFIDIEAAVTGG